FMLPPDQIAKRLSEIGEHPYLAPAERLKVQLEPEDQYKKVLSLVRRFTGVDFSQYRDTTISRRIMRRMALHGQQSLADYAALLEKNRGEIEALYSDLLINVTSFFREPSMFAALKAHVFPEIHKHKAAK